MCEATCIFEFPEGWGEGSEKKIPSLGEVWMFFGTTHWHVR